MKAHQLKATTPKRSKRVGRGIAAGRGKTAGRGTKGQGARSGWSKKPGFEGGQNPLMQRLPKLRGFTSKRVKATNVYTGQLEAFGGKTVTAATLAEAGVIANAHETVKVVVKGNLTKSVTVQLAGASVAAVAAIEKAGGSFTKTDRIARAKTSEQKIKKSEAKADKK